MILSLNICSNMGFIVFKPSRKLIFFIFSFLACFIDKAIKGAVVSKPTARKITSKDLFSFAILSASKGEYITFILL